MAKTNQPKTNQPKTPTASKGIGTRDWRGHTVFFCLTPGCVADSEVKGNIERHIQRGRHRIQGKIVKVGDRGPEAITPIDTAPIEDANEGDD